VNERIPSRRLLLAMLTMLVPVAILVADELVVESTVVRPVPDDSGISSALVEFVVPSPGDPVVTTGVRLALRLEHPWVGDLRVTLRSPDGSTEVVVLDRPGLVPAGFPGPFGCGGDDLDVVFDDSATASAQDTCSLIASPVLAGPLRPLQPLQSLSGVDPEGAWSLIVTDLQAGDSGEVLGASLLVEFEVDCDQDGLPDECTCPGDLDGDGLVGGADLSGLLSQWNGPGKADLDTNGVVDGADLAILISAWGSCR